MASTAVRRVALVAVIRRDGERTGGVGMKGSVGSLTLSGASVQQLLDLRRTRENPHNRAM
jgi:hypothetical protein